MFLSFGASAQSLKIVDTDASQRGIIGGDIRTTFKIKNITNKPIYFSVSEVKKQIGSSQKSFLCIDNDCDKSNIVSRTENIPDMIHKIMPGQTSESIVAVLESGLVASISSVTYRFTNVKHPNDFIDFEFQYDIEERLNEGLLYSSTNVDLTDVYPNPVTEFAVFDYRIKNDSKEAKIIIHNVLGSIAGEYKLNPFEQQLKVSVEDFNPGVYFYSLYIDNEGVATKKLVVRK
jgi:hypothetical protein